MTITTVKLILSRTWIVGMGVVDSPAAVHVKGRSNGSTRSYPSLLPCSPIEVRM